MLENHAFDNMLGWLPGLSNPLTSADCNSYAGVNACATRRGAYEDPDPDHSVQGTALEIYGTSTPANEHDPAAVLMSGFVHSYAATKNNNASFGAAIMDCFDPPHVPVITALASQFTLLENYHASVPGPTFPNRLFAMSATSHGFGDNDPVQTALGWPQTSIFGKMDAAGVSSRVYFSDVPSALLLSDARNLSSGATGYKFVETDFAKDVAAGDLAAFTWVEPSYLDIPGIKATDEHPAHVRAGVAVSRRLRPTPRRPVAVSHPLAPFLRPRRTSPLASASSRPSTRRFAQAPSGTRRPCSSLG